MTTTGSYSYNPAAANLTMVAFGRVGLRRAELTTQHMADAENEINLLQVEMSNRQPNLWRGQTYESALTAGVATTTLPEQVIAIAAAYISITTGNQTIDRIIWPLSTFEYAALPDKLQEGPPTSYWYDRQSTPQITFWPVPDVSATYTAKLRVFSQIQDATLVGGKTIDMPYRWLDAWVAGLAARLADLYPDPLIKTKGPGAIQDMWAKAERAWTIAATEDKERVPLYLQPQTQAYWN